MERQVERQVNRVDEHMTLEAAASREGSHELGTPHVEQMGDEM